MPKFRLTKDKGAITRTGHYVKQARHWAKPIVGAGPLPAPEPDFVPPDFLEFASVQKLPFSPKELHAAHMMAMDTRAIAAMKSKGVP